MQLLFLIRKTKKKAKQIKKIFDELNKQYLIQTEDYSYDAIQNFARISNNFSDMANTINDFVEMICAPTEEW